MRNHFYSTGTPPGIYTIMPRKIFPTEYNTARPKGRCKTCLQPCRKTTQCTTCARAEVAASPPRQCPDCRETSRNYLRPNSVRCKGCVKRREQEKRLSQPPQPCIDCGVITCTVNMLWHKNRCLPCAKIIQDNKPKKPITSNTAQAIRRRRYRASQPLFKLRSNIGTLISNSLRSGGYVKSQYTEEILGCTYSEFCKHIESQFTEGMSFENYGEWHIDHIIPQSTGYTEIEVLELNNYKNLQPLWAADNLKKGASYDCNRN